MKATRLSSLTLAAFSLLCPAWGQGLDPASQDDSLTSLSYISYLERYATIFPAAQKQSLDAVVNMPVLPGDRVETSRGSRVEIQLADGSTVWLDQFTTLDFDAIASSRGSSATRTSLYLSAGTVAVEVAATSPSIRMDSRAGTVYLTKKGLYRLEARDQQLHVAAFQGAAELPAGMGSVLLRSGFAAWVAHGEEVERASWDGYGDDFWQWVLERRNPPTSSTTLRYLQTSRAYILDSYGDWVYVDEFGAYGWRPRVSVTWVPYRHGRWYWTPTGWCWVSYEPWGWYPYHYGSWYFSVGVGWVWFWDSVWAPAWVHWIYTPGYVGWCPRGYYDWWWWRHCSECGRRPYRWSQVTFDFSGRVRLGDVDPRPWTLVSEDRFTYSHIDQVRVDPDQFFRSLGPDRPAYVRSGPLAGRPAPDGRVSFRSSFEDPLSSTHRDAARFLRRQPVSNDHELPPIRLTSEHYQPGKTRLGSAPNGHLRTPARQGEPGLRDQNSEQWSPAPERSSPSRAATPPKGSEVVQPPERVPRSAPARRPSTWEKDSPAPQGIRRPLERSNPSETPGNDSWSSHLERRSSPQPSSLPEPPQTRRVVPRSAPSDSLNRWPTSQPRVVIPRSDGSHESSASPRLAPDRLTPRSPSFAPGVRSREGSSPRPSGTTYGRPGGSSSSRPSAPSGSPASGAAKPSPQRPRHDR